MGVRHFLGRNEILSVLIICAVMAAVAGISLLQSGFFFSDKYDNIAVDYSDSGEYLIIKERFDISIVSNFRVLYRSFEDDSCISGDCDVIVSDVRCSLGEPYYSSPEGDIYDAGSASLKSVPSFIGHKIRDNEVGCYLSDDYYGGKKEVLEVEYRVPMSSVRSRSSTHYLFSQDHFPIVNLEVAPLSGNKVSVLYIEEDYAVKINVDSGKVETKTYNMLLSVLLMIAIIIGPFLIWKFFGTEKKAIVPEYLHTVPDKHMEGWQVDILTNGTGKMSKNGLASILMSLYVKKAIDIKVEKSFLSKKAIVTIPKDYDKKGLTKKEKELCDILISHKDREDNNGYVSEIKSGERAFAMDMAGFFEDYESREFYKKAIDQKGFMILVASLIVSMGITLFLIGGVHRIFSSLFTYGYIFVVIGVAVAIPRSVFSRFRGDFYRKYLEWLSFDNMLDDYAQIKKYLKEDHVIWKEWLTYAVAMGSAEKLLKSMKELEIIDAKYYESMHTFHATTFFIATASMPKSSAGGGGGFGGGGFGGGGGGGR